MRPEDSHAKGASIAAAPRQILPSVSPRIRRVSCERASGTASSSGFDTSRHYLVGLPQMHLPAFGREGRLLPKPARVVSHTADRPDGRSGGWLWNHE